MKKICIKCGEERTDFYKHPKSKDGYLSKCKKCCKEDSNNNFHRKMENEEFRISERLRTKERIDNTQKSRKFRKKYPEKHKAYNAIRYLIKPRNLPKNTVCHHWSYNDGDLLDVIYIDDLKHKYIHRFITYNQISKMYERKDTGELLNSKQKHEDFVNSIND